MLVKIWKGAFMKLVKLTCLLAFIIIAGCGSNQPTAGNIDPSLAKIGDPFRPDLWPEGCPNPLQPDQDPVVQLSCAIQYLVKLPDGTPFTNPHMSWEEPDLYENPDTPNEALFRPGPGGGNGSTNCDSPSVSMSTSGGGDRGVFANCSGSVSLTIGLGGGNPGLRATVSNGSGSVTANIGGSGTTSSGNYGSSSGGFATAGMRDYCALYPYSSMCW
jgi:hypothetical protein